MKSLAPKIIMCICTTAVLTACSGSSPFQSKNIASCSSEETQALIPSLIKEQAEKLIKAEIQPDSSPVKLDLSKARATIEQIKISVENIRTVKEDPNSTKKFCKATVKFTIPTELLDNINKTTELGESLGTNKRFDFKEEAQKEGFEINANIASRDFEYNSQASDDNKHVFVELEQGKPLAELLGVVAMFDQLKSQVETLLSEAKERATANQEAATANAKAELDQAQRDNLAARKALNATWNAMPKEYQDAQLAGQKAWVAQRKAQCGAVSEGEVPDFTNPDSVSKFIGKLICSTGMTNERNQVLMTN